MAADGYCTRDRVDKCPSAAALDVNPGIVL